MSKPVITWANKAVNKSMAKYSAAWDGLVGLYGFRIQGGGDTAFDLRGRNDGTIIHSPPWVAGGIDLDGANDYVQVSTASSINKSYDEITLLMLGISHGRSAAWQGISGGCRGTDNFVVQYYNVSNTLGYLWGGEFGFSNGPTIVPDKYGLFVVTVSVSKNQGVAYVCQDGVISSVVNTGYTHTSKTLDDWKLFWDEAIGDRKFDGLADTVAIYDRVLTDGEIAQWYALGLAYPLERRATMLYDMVAAPAGTILPHMMQLSA